MLFSRAKQKREALVAFREACRLRPGAWQMWQNASLAAAELRHFGEAIYRAREALARGGTPDVDAAPILASAVANNLVATDGQRARKWLPEIRALLAACCERAPNHPASWETRVFLERKCGGPAELRECMEGRLMALRTSTPWRTDSAALSEVAEVAAQLVELELDDTDEKRIRSVQATAAALLHAAEEHLPATEGAESLRMLVTRLHRHVDL